jgi:hypothetical protein
MYGEGRYPNGSHDAEQTSEMSSTCVAVPTRRCRRKRRSDKRGYNEAANQYFGGTHERVPIANVRPRATKHMQK